MCEGRVAAIQGVEDEPLLYCPDCGLGVKRVVSKAAFKVSNAGSLDKAGSRGFTTWKKVETGKWEKVSGPGADMLVGDPRDVESLKAEATPKRILDLDSPSG